MNSELQMKCIEVLEKIKERPTSKWFMDPVDPNKDHCPDYFQLITRPSDLSTVQSKLENGEYKTVAQFKEDLSLIWSNCLKYWSEESLISTLAIDLKQYSERLLNFISDQPHIDWINELMYLIEELSSATKPLTYNSVSSKKRSPSNPSIKQYDMTQDDDVEEIKFTQEDLENLKTDIDSFTTDDAKTQLAECIKTILPRLFSQRPVVSVNLCNLSPQALKALSDKVEELKSGTSKDKVDAKGNKSSKESDSD
ncbi:Bromodomain containing protein [Trichomonas vaginalis G3]|uniref:Bromodomain containing protein n=1 Tax=Trichomonas vaginalis (strain ATCC PRA-98 / G3) TaxID=412133 RepID=A2DYA7_TRIV3|nr:acetylation-dependent protein binding [Trichomonas vaginalis G3]EAY14584.1 Bromodomain containing protein [Trichomonas vaginalis G3]KAI5526595.1 acetylation-dependent protein binding [Trichomonas vaginalis G3]|eukprot:XP_001326807.1 Bromodomain containing protein [Trichomonas vaginalis G3]